MKYYEEKMFGSYCSAVEYFEKAFAEGWRIDKSNPPEQVGFSYALTLVRDDAPAVKLTRAEILTKARAARTVKKKETTNV